MTTPLPQQQTESQPPRRPIVRFTAAQRFEHLLMIVTFTGLALTGLVQRYAGTDIGKTLIDVMGGIESIRILHRILATILMAEVIYHGGVISYKLLVLGVRATMLPSLRDARDALQWVAYNLGLRREHPHMPRYNFGEKVEYLAFVWGTVVMVITGFILWNPITTTTVLPGEVIPAARLAHSAEAVLAVLSIIIWHMYNVHVRRFNRSMFTGKLDYDAMQEEHAEELAQIERGEAGQRFPPEVIARRRRWFTPYAVVMTTVLVVGLIWFVTHETSAVDTVPRQATAPEPLDADALMAASDAMSGEIAWQEADCAACHGENGEGAEGALNIALAGTPLDLEAFVAAVRRGPADMPAVSPAEMDNQTVANIWAWLASQPAPE